MAVLGQASPRMAQSDNGPVALIVLKDPTSALTATFVPSAGMICTSLSDGGVELLGQRRGLNAYLDNRQDDGYPDSLPVGQPAERQRLRGRRRYGDPDPGRGRGAHRRPRPGDPRGAGRLPGLAGHAGADNKLIADLDFGGQPGCSAAFPSRTSSPSTSRLSTAR